MVDINQVILDLESKQKSILDGIDNRASHIQIQHAIGVSNGIALCIGLLKDRIQGLSKEHIDIDNIVYNYRIIE